MEANRHRLPDFLRLAAPMRFTARRRKTEYRLPMGFARAEGTHFIHCYILATATQFSFKNDY